MSAKLPRPEGKPVRLTGYALKALRTEVWYRDGGKCMECGTPVAFENGGFKNMHMAHIRSRGAGGEDTLENCRSLCLQCHLVGEHNPKSVPSKVSL